MVQAIDRSPNLSKIQSYPQDPIRVITPLIIYQIQNLTAMIEQDLTTNLQNVSDYVDFLLTRTIFHIDTQHPIIKIEKYLNKLDSLQTRKLMDNPNDRGAEDIREQISRVRTQEYTTLLLLCMGYTAKYMKSKASQDSYYNEASKMTISPSNNQYWTNRRKNIDASRKLC